MFTFALTDGRTIEAENLVEFVHQHFARGDEVDVMWAERERFDDGAILSIAAEGRPDTSVSVVSNDGDGLSIGGTEPSGVGLVSQADPLGDLGPIREPRLAALLAGTATTSPGGAPNATRGEDRSPLACRSCAQSLPNQSECLGRRRAGRYRGPAMATHWSQRFRRSTCGSL